MRPQNVLLAMGALFGAARAGYYSIAAPETIKPGEPFDIILVGDLITKTGYGLGVAYGIAEGEGYYMSLGTLLDTFALNPMEEDLHNRTFTLTLPDDFSKGKATLRATMSTMAGVFNHVDIMSFKLPVEVGDETSDRYIRGERELEY